MREIARGRVTVAATVRRRHDRFFTEFAKPPSATRSRRPVEGPPDLERLGARAAKHGMDTRV